MNLLAMFTTVLITCNTLLAQPTKLVAPGGPGADAHWPTAAKEGFGTSTSLRSKVWFTLANGVMTEVFYPTLDKPNSQSLKFIVCSPQKCVDENDAKHSLRNVDDRSLSFEQTSTADTFTLTKT